MNPVDVTLIIDQPTASVLFVDFLGKLNLNIPPS